MSPRTEPVETHTNYTALIAAARNLGFYDDVAHWEAERDRLIAERARTKAD